MQEVETEGLFFITIKELGSMTSVFKEQLFDCDSGMEGGENEEEVEEKEEK